MCLLNLLMKIWKNNYLEKRELLVQFPFFTCGLIAFIAIYTIANFSFFQAISLTETVMLSPVWSVIFTSSGLISSHVTHPFSNLASIHDWIRSSLIYFYSATVFTDTTIQVTISDMIIHYFMLLVKIQKFFYHESDQINHSLRLNEQVFPSVQEFFFQSDSSYTGSLYLTFRLDLPAASYHRNLFR